MLNSLKISKFIIKSNPLNPFRAFCFDDDQNVFFCTSDMNIQKLKIINNNELQGGMEQIQKMKTINLSEIKPEMLELPTAKIVDRGFFDEIGEEVVDISLFSSFVNKTYLLIITNNSIFSKKLFKSSTSTFGNGQNLVNNEPKPVKIFSINTFLKNKFGIQNFSVVNIVIVAGNIFIRVVNNDAFKTRKSNQKQPCYYIIRLCLEKKVQRKNSVFALESAITNIETLQIIQTSYLPLFQIEIEEFWVDSNELEMVYFSIKNKLYKGELIQTGRDENQYSDLGICHLLYRNNYGIRFLQFSLHDNLVIFSDKPDRVVLLNKSTWEKVSDFQLKLGEIMTIKWNEELNLIFM